MALDHNGELINNEKENCEMIVEDIWKSLYHSDDPIKRKAADSLSPMLSLSAELCKVLSGNDIEKTYAVSKIIQKYSGPKDTITDYKSAKQALDEVRAYTSNQKV